MNLFSLQKQLSKKIMKVGNLSSIYIVERFNKENNIFIKMMVKDRRNRNKNKNRNKEMLVQILQYNFKMISLLTINRQITTI